MEIQPERGDAVPNYEACDCIEFKMLDEPTGGFEWLWLVVERDDAAKRVVFGCLDSRPLVFDNGLRLGQELAVSYDNIREHRKPNQF